MAEVINGLLLLLCYLILEMFFPGCCCRKNICTNKLLVLPALLPNVFLICQIRKGVNAGKEVTLPRKSLSSDWFQGQVVLCPPPLCCHDHGTLVVRQCKWSQGGDSQADADSHHCKSFLQALQTCSLEYVNDT